MKILGLAEATAKQMSKYLLSVNVNPKFSVKMSVEDFCQLFIDVCSQEGVRGDLAFAQACKETGNFKFNGDVKYTQNNFCGLGATGGGVCGCSFKTISEGILAQAQHLKTYATTNDLCMPCVDPRRSGWFVRAKGGTSPDVEGLGGTWAVPGYDTKKYKSLEDANKKRDSYGYQIINILNDILSIREAGDNNMGYTNSPLVSYVKLSPNNSGQRTHCIDRITPHCVVGQVTVERLGQIFSNPSRKASCQYGIGLDGKVGMYCEEKNRSWCSSSNPNDQRSVTIECASDTTHPYAFKDVVYNKLIDLCVDICQRNGKNILIWIPDKETALKYNPKSNEMLLTVHRWFAKKSCPGQWMMDRMADLAAKVSDRLGGITPTPTPTPTPTTNLVDKGMENAYKFTGVKDTDVSKAKARVLQHAMNLDYKANQIAEDGMFGPKSKAKLGTHYVKKGETQYMVTAAEILMYLNNIDPNGVEYPGTYGNGLVKASKTKFGDDGLKIDSNEFLKLL